MAVKGGLWEMYILFRHAMIWWSWKEKEKMWKSQMYRYT